MSGGKLLCNGPLLPLLVHLKTCYRPVKSMQQLTISNFQLTPIGASAKPNNLLFWKDPEPYPIFLWRGKPLPWVEKLKHLEHTNANGCQLDMEYIEKNNSLRQEQYFAHPQCKFMINYNSHYTGSQPWLLDSKEMDKMELQQVYQGHVQPPLGHS